MDHPNDKRWLHRDQVITEFYLNVEFGSAFLAYRPGDAMRMADSSTFNLYEYDGYSARENDLAMLDRLWAWTQDDDTVWGDRSLSCGDVVSINGIVLGGGEDGRIALRSYAVSTVGWVEVDPPLWGHRQVGPKGDEALRVTADLNPDIGGAISAGFASMAADLRATNS